MATVIQADRDAASRVTAITSLRLALRKGLRDNHPIVQTIAAHREASTTQLEADKAELLLALYALFASYKDLAESGDAGFWSLEDQPVGKQALAAIARIEGEQP